jgi:hypothetical protein
MAQTEISSEKIRAYEATDYRAGSGADALVRGIGQHSPKLALRYIDTGADCALFIARMYSDTQVKWTGSYLRRPG